MLHAARDMQDRYPLSLAAQTAAERLTRGYGVAETRCLAFVYDKITPQSATVIMIASIVGKSTNKA